MEKKLEIIHFLFVEQKKFERMNVRPDKTNSWIFVPCLYDLPNGK